MPLLVCIPVLAAAVMLPSAPAEAAQGREVLQLWPGGAPGAQGQDDRDKPTVTMYFPAEGKANGTAVVVCPGGGYGGLADYEGGPPAEWLNSLGVTAAVLKYRLGPRYHHPIMLQDAGRALRLLRSHAGDWKLDTHRIGILGFSAGGHLASTAETHFDAGSPDAADPVDRLSSRPDIGILIYPVVTFRSDFTHMGSRQNLLGPDPSPELVDLLSNEKQVTAQTPPTFLVCSNADRVVPFENSVLFAMALHKAGVPVELHLYEKGEHGFGMGGSDPVLSTWPTSCAAWLKGRGFLGK